MNRHGHDNVVYFVGPEVEHTPAFSKKTLFVVGKQKVGDIETMAQEYKTPHIYLGANHSFNVESEDPYWNEVLTTLLDKGYWVTLDYQAHHHNILLKMLSAGVWQCRRFVPLLSVRIPKLQSTNPNLTVKFDDIDFKATNPGVWCLHFHEITDSNRFTDWTEYGNDEVVSPIIIPPLGERAPERDWIGLTPEQLSKAIEKKNEEKESTIPVASTAVEAAEAYAEDIKEDPLSKTKKVKPKKAEQ